MKKLFLIVCASLLALTFSVPVQAVPGEDNLGVVAPVKVAKSSTGVFGAASAESVVTPPNTYTTHNWDISFTVGTTGANNDDGTEENMLLGVGLLVYVAKNAAIGVAVNQPDLAQSMFQFQPLAKLYMFRDPLSSWNKGLLFKPLSWNIAVGDNAPITGGAFTVNPTLSAFVEFPVGGGALALDIGYDYLMTELSNDVEDDWGSLQANVTYIWWAVR